MILPDRCLIMNLLASWASSKAAVRLTETIGSHRSRPNSSTSASSAMPAELTRMSTEPSVSAQRFTVEAGTPGSVMSATMNSNRRPAPSTSRRVVPSSSARPTANTSAPALARATENARPRPVLPPVTRALRPPRQNRSRLKSAMSTGQLPSGVVGACWNVFGPCWSVFGACLSVLVRRAPARARLGPGPGARARGAWRSSSGRRPWRPW
jgi:hypothetical protein